MVSRCTLLVALCIFGVALALPKHYDVNNTVVKQINAALPKNELTWEMMRDLGKLERGEGLDSEEVLHVLNDFIDVADDSKDVAVSEESKAKALGIIHAIGACETAPNNRDLIDSVKEYTVFSKFVQDSVSKGTSEVIEKSYWEERIPQIITQLYG